MRRTATKLVVVTLLAAVLAVPGFARKKKKAELPPFESLEPQAAASAFFDRALELAGQGSWERLDVARALYLGGMTDRASEIVDAVTSSKKVVASDWVRVGRICAAAGELDRAVAAFESAIVLEPKEEDLMIELGAILNVKGERERAEELFRKGLEIDAEDLYNLDVIGASYLGVLPRAGR